MIRFSLTCAEGHDFDSWFRSGADFDALSAAGRLSCAVCGSSQVDKRLMAPAVAVSQAGPGALDRPASPVEAELAALRERLERESDYVGLSFAAEARAMHEGDKPQRNIWGEARPDEARALIEDGIPVAPLPFLPKPKLN